MNVLFVSSGNGLLGINPIVQSQAESLSRDLLSVNLFTIKGKGFMGYLKSIPALREHLNNNQYDILHSHYSFSGIVTALTFKKIPIIVSLMGSDVQMALFWRVLIKLFAAIFWKAIIVKSPEMKDLLKLKSAWVIPNGVNLEKMKKKEGVLSTAHVGFDLSRKNIVFLSNPDRYEKNYPLAKNSVDLLKDKNIVLHTIYNIPNDQVPDYLHAADVLISTSRWEGSPNVIKEAMACNCPVVSTDVGDVRWLFGDTEGYYLTSFDPGDIAEKIKMALDFSKTNGRTKGRDRIISLGLDSGTVANRIISVYKEVIGNNK